MENLNKFYKLDQLQDAFCGGDTGKGYFVQNMIRVAKFKKDCRLKDLET